jgi:hypothetical protein
MAIHMIIMIVKARSALGSQNICLKSSAKRTYTVRIEIKILKPNPFKNYPIF